MREERSERGRGKTRPKTAFQACFFMLRSQTRHWLEAAEHGHDSVMTQLLEKHPQLITATDSSHETALSHAAANGHEKVVALLLAAEPKLVTTVHWNGSTSLHLAAIGGYENIVALLLAVDTNIVHATDSLQRTALHLAAQKGHDRVASQLLAASPRLIHAVDNSLWTALHFAANSILDTTKVIEVLLAHYPRLTLARDLHGNCPLYMAANHQSQEVLTRLYEQHPEVLHAKNKRGRTPFERALLFEYQVAIELFQPKMTFDEIVLAFTVCKKQPARLNA